MCSTIFNILYGQGGLACCNSWGRKESDTTERLNWTELIVLIYIIEMHIIEVVAPKPSRNGCDYMVVWTRNRNYGLRTYQSVQSVQLLSRVQLFAIPWTAARQPFLSITNSRSLLKLMSIESVMPSNHLILCCPLLLLPPIPPSIRVFSNESVLCIRWTKYWSVSFSISPSNEYSGLISF